jgi:hypothetical protein
MKQGSEEWIRARLGKVTASRIADVVARAKSGGWGASRDNLMADIICERLTGQPQETYVSAAMQHGTDNEPLARAAYEFYADRDVKLVGFVEHPTIPMAGGSPDGLVGNDGLVQFKCPNSKTHISTLLGASIDGVYIKQMQFEMAVTGRKWCHFVSFDPRLSGDLQFHMRLVERSDALISELEREVVIFLKEVAEKEVRLRNLARGSSTLKDQLVGSLAVTPEQIEAAE